MSLMRSLIGLASLKVKLFAAATLLVIILLVVVLLGAISSMYMIISEGEGTSSSPVITGSVVFNKDVERYRTTVLKELKKYEKEELVNVILAIIQVETGGSKTDPMNTSMFVCGTNICLTNPEISIQKGVEIFINLLEKSSNNIELAIHSYDLGTSFIDFVLERGGTYHYQLAVAYSKEVYLRVKDSGEHQCISPEAIIENACYGDILYLNKVLQYQSHSGIEGKHTPLDYQKIRVTSAFGYRTIDRGLEHHNGVDYACVNDVDPIYAVESGTVVIAGRYSGAVTYGNFVTIKHSDTFYTTYAHLNSVTVQANTQVLAGQQIGICGNTGRSFGSHLHFETKTQMWKGHYNPEPFVNDIVQRILINQSQGEYAYD